MSLAHTRGPTVPFIALVDGELRSPFEMDADVEGTCPACGNTLRIRDSHQRGESFVAAHFWHPTTPPDGCSGTSTGESDEHKRMKSIAASKATSVFPEATVTIEHQIGSRRADVFVSFEEGHPRYGSGIAIEVQYKHESKDKPAVTQHYREREYSVLWLDTRQFSQYDVDFTSGMLAAWWAAQVPDSSEWSGYHDIIYWLKQPLNPKVERSIPIPREFFSSDYAEEWTRRLCATHQPRHGWSSIFSAPIYDSGRTVSEIGLAMNQMCLPRVFLRKTQRGKTECEDDPNLVRQLDDLRRIAKILDGWDVEHRRNWVRTRQRSGDWVRIETISTGMSELKLLCKVETGEPTLVLEDHYDGFVSALADPEIATDSIHQVVNLARTLPTDAIPQFAKPK